MVVTPAKEMTGDFADSRSRHTFIVAASKERAPRCRRIVLAARAARVRSALTNVRPRIAEEKIGVVVMVITS
jgi:hypothetical protein